MFHVKHNNDSLTETAKQLFGVEPRSGSGLQISD